MRLFFAATIPDDIRADLARRLDLEPGLRGLVRSRPEALHITVRFVGDTEPARVATVQVAGAAIAAQRSLSIRIEGAGVFPDDRAPTVFWAGVGGEVAEMSAIAQTLETALVSAGFSADSRRFSPHLTLGRARKGGRLGSEAAVAFRRSLAGYESRFFDVKEIDLFRSHLGPVGPRYEMLTTFPLA